MKPSVNITALDDVCWGVGCVASYNVFRDRSWLHFKSK